ncbi:hypothetical protein PSEEN2540 [Pseudomonas entomophila L48]|uniref:Uncharacterized protein n=1 Tax=Pseudomonas entomophila (strain L48) TaxID=384676 RepID=Q1IAH7_PSEE4|nr:hypothetical protein PSEEN2540 [Pseudomonas entomophila L48]
MLPPSPASFPTKKITYSCQYGYRQAHYRHNYVFMLKICNCNDGKDNSKHYCYDATHPEHIERVRLVLRIPVSARINKALLYGPRSICEMMKRITNSFATRMLLLTCRHVGPLSMLPNSLQ